MKVEYYTGDAFPNVIARRKSTTPTVVAQVHSMSISNRTDDQIVAELMNPNNRIPTLQIETSTIKIEDNTDQSFTYSVEFKGDVGLLKFPVSYQFVHPSVDLEARYNRLFVSFRRNNQSIEMADKRAEGEISQLASVASANSSAAEAYNKELEMQIRQAIMMRRENDRAKKNEALSSRFSK